MKKSLEDVLEGLTEKMKVFVMEYCADGDGVRSCKEAGYNGNRQVLANRANRLLNLPKVKRAIAEIKRPYMEEAGLTIKLLTKQLYRFVTYDIAPYLDKQGFLKCEPGDLPEEVRQCITDWDIRERYDKDGDLVARRVKVKGIDKMAAVNTAAKHLGMLQPDVNLNDNRTFINFGELYDEGSSGEELIEGKFRELETFERSDDV